MHCFNVYDVLHLKLENSNYHLYYSSVSDPDLTINVDLGREEEEKNGRRKYIII